MTEKKEQQLAPVRVPRKWVILARIVVAAVFVIWVAGIFYFHSRVQATEQKILQLRQKRQQQEELQRRKALYQQAIMERQAKPAPSQNAVDAFKR